MANTYKTSGKGGNKPPKSSGTKGKGKPPKMPASSMKKGGGKGC